ncbi:MAG: SDR family NAD(P)-dependent oxidoreductase [Gammaproteobacteria bacterium]|nr:SDR family NAD(P)-dependent oxidoreductase [Gammaproteobacteria bacterium]
MSLKGRVALVTGGSRGIGRAIALALAEDGADIAVNYRRDDAEAARTVASIKALGRRAAAFKASVDVIEEDAAMVERVKNELGPISILINNAGIASRGNTVADTDPLEMARVVGVHAFAPFYLSKLVLPQMRGTKRGDIIVISSVATLFFAARGAPYNMGKAAGEAFAYTLAKEERPHNIYVNVVAPPLTDTDMGQRLAKSLGIAQIHDLDKTAPFGHVCAPEDVANVVRFLVSERNTYVSGEKISVHGGADRPGFA